MLMLTSASTAEVVQLTVGAIMGAALSINMHKFGMSLMDPKTRWNAVAGIIMFVVTFLFVTDLIIN